MSNKFDFNYRPLGKDKIESMSEDDIITFMRKYKRVIKEAKNSGRDSTPYEVEYCYLDHELQMRRSYGYNKKK